MQSRGVHLEYSFQRDGQRGAEVHNPLFELLSKVRDEGSIQHAAKAMGASYRHVWGALKHWQTVLGEPLVNWSQGQPARLTPFADRLLWAETRARARLVPQIEALRAELERVLAEAFDGDRQVLTIYASHDQALARLRERTSVQHRLHMDLRFAGSIDALRALAEGRCAVAGFHVPPLAEARNLYARSLKPLLKPGLHRLIGCARRSQGLMLAPGNPLGVRSLADLVRQPLRFVNRQEGSGTRLLTDHLLAQQGLPPAQIGGYFKAGEDSHLAVAAAIASGIGDAGMGIAAAASSFGLEFLPLMDEDYFLVCKKDALDQPAVRQLCLALRSPDWPALLQTLPGYKPRQSGEILSLTRALPWWRVRRPKAGPATAAPPPVAG